jgi:hypothetical protein
MLKYTKRQFYNWRRVELESRPWQRRLSIVHGRLGFDENKSRSATLPPCAPAGVHGHLFRGRSQNRYNRRYYKTKEKDVFEKDLYSRGTVHGLFHVSLPH